LIHDVEKLGVKIHLNVDFSPNLIKKGEYDGVIIAMGSSPLRPNIPGINHPNVIVARDLIEGGPEVKGRS